MEVQLDSFKEEKSKEIEELTVEVGELTREILGKGSGKRDQERGKAHLGRATGRPRGRPQDCSSSQLQELVEFDGIQDLVGSHQDNNLGVTLPSLTVSDLSDSDSDGDRD